MGELDSSLEVEIKKYHRLARLNYRTAYLLSAVAVLASIMAGLSVAAGWFTKGVLAVLSSLPGAVLVISDRLRFEERSAWHYRKMYALKALQYQLRFEKKAEDEVSAAWRKLVEDAESKWPGFGKPPTAND